MYIGLLLLLPMMMLLARLRLWLPIAAGVAIWSVAHIFKISPPSHHDGQWYFNPLGWQLLFAVGLVWGIAFRRGESILFIRPLYWAAVAYLAVAGIFVWFELWGLFPELPTWVWVDGFDKGWLGFFRFFHILALCYVVAWSPIPGLLKDWLHADNPIVRIGRNTLPVFCLGSILSNVGLIIRWTVFGMSPEFEPTMKSIVLDTAIVAGGVALLYGLARFLDWSREERRAGASRTHEAPIGTAAVRAD